MKMNLKFNQRMIDKAEADIKAKVKEIIKSPELLNEIGDIAIKDIQFQARRGISTDGSKFTKALTPKWVRQRENIAKATQTHETFKANRNNITITGQLLNSLRKYSTGNKITLFFAGFHNPYKAKYLEYFTRKKKKRRINMGRTVKGFQTSAGGISYVNTGREGTYTVGKSISNDKLSGYVNQIRPFFKIRESLLPRLKNIVIRYIRRKL
jgi:hypothetical protein